MGLQRVSRSYLADDSGIKDLAMAAAMGQACLAAASQMAAQANATGKGDYSASLAVVTSGWANERRMGAVVRESRRDWRDTRDTVLLKVAAAMGRRGT
jgi:hypothetical protein